MASSNLLHNWQSIGAKEEAILEDVYKKTPDPPATVKLDLALELHVSPQNIGRWFSARKRRDAGERRANRKDPEQLEVLERYFSRNPFPTREEKAEICEQTGCSLRQINSWFQHSRKKHNMTDLNNLPGTCLRQWHKQAADHIRSAIIEQNEKIFGDALGPAEGDETAEPASAYDSNVTLNDQAPHKPQTRSRPSKRKRAKSPESGASEQEEEELSGRGVAEDFSIDEDRDDPTYSDHQKEDIGQRRSQRRQAQHRRIGGKPEATTRALSTNTSRSRTPTDFEPIHIQHAAAVSDSFSRPSDSGPLPMFSTNDIGPSRGHGSGSLGGPSAAGDSDGYTPNRMSVTFPARVPFVVQQDAPGRPAVLKLPSPNESEGSPEGYHNGIEVSCVRDFNQPISDD